MAPRSAASISAPARIIAPLVALAALAPVSLASAQAAFQGTWRGPGEIIKGIPVCTGGQIVGCQSAAMRALYAYQLAFHGSSAGYRAEGPDAASHNPVSAKGHCSMRMLRYRVAAGWTYFRPAARATFSGEGGPGVFCQTTPIATGAYVLRVRKAGAKLRVEFGFEPKHTFGSYTYLTRV